MRHQTDVGQRRFVAEHAGLLGPNETYTGRATLSLPRDLQGDFYVLVDTNTARTVTETGRTGNNVGASPAIVRIALSPSADLTVSNVSGPIEALTGETVTVTYTAANVGQTAANSPWRDRVYLDTTTACIVDDPLLARRIRIEKRHSRATVVWNPGREKARAVPDIGDAWRSFVCVETANCGPHAVHLAPHARHAMTARIDVTAQR